MKALVRHKKRDTLRRQTSATTFFCQLAVLSLAEFASRKWVRFVRDAASISDSQIAAMLRFLLHVWGQSKRLQ